MTSKEILNDQSKIKSYSNSVANWFAISRDGMHQIVLNENNHFYTTQKAWAKRVSQLIKRGY